MFTYKGVICMKLTHTYNYMCKDIFVKGNILDMIDSIRILSNK